MARKSSYQKDEENKFENGKGCFREPDKCFKDVDQFLQKKILPFNRIDGRGSIALCLPHGKNSFLANQKYIQSYWRKK